MSAKCSTTLKQTSYYTFVTWVGNQLVEGWCCLSWQIAPLRRLHVAGALEGSIAFPLSLFISFGACFEQY